MSTSSTSSKRRRSTALTVELQTLVNGGDMTLLQARNIMQERDVFSSHKRSKRRNEKSTISQDLQMLVNEGSMTKIQAERIMNDRTTTNSGGDGHTKIDRLVIKRVLPSPVNLPPTVTCQRLQRSWAPSAMNIIDCRTTNATEQVDRARSNGIPVVLTGFPGMTLPFAKRWVNRNQEPDFKQISKDLGKEIVTVIEKKDMEDIAKNGGLEHGGKSGKSGKSVAMFLTRSTFAP